MLRKLGIEQGEERLFAWGAAALFLVGWADVSVKNVSETIFIKRVGVSLLPYWFLASAIVLVGTTWVTARLAARGDRLRLLPLILLVLAGSLVPLWFLILKDATTGLGLLVIASKQLQSIALLIFFLAFADLVHGRQAKRLFAPLMAGFTLGNILGSFASEPISEAIGIAGLLPYSAGTLVAAAAVTLPLARLRPSGLAPHRGRGRTQLPVAAHLDEVQGREGMQALWRGNRLFRLLFVGAACSGLVGPMLYFQFSYVADLATQGAGGEAKLMAFYSQFRGWIGFGVLVTQLGLTANLYRRIGVPLATAISPLLYLVGFIGLGFRMGLPAGVVAMSGTKLQDNAVYDPAVRVLYNLFPESIRAQAMALLEGPIKRAGGAVGNVATIVAMELASAAWVGYAALPVAGIWLASVLLLRRTYPALLLQASTQRHRFGETFDPKEMLDVNTLRSLSKHLRDPDPARARVAIGVVAEAEGVVAADILAEAARTAPDATRPLLIAALDRALERSVASNAVSETAAAHLAALLEEPGRLCDSDRADIVQAYGRVAGAADGSGPDAVLENFLGDFSPAVQLAAAAALSRRGHLSDPDFELDARLEAAIGSSDPILRRIAREELRALLLRSSPDPDWRDRLSRLAKLLALPEDRGAVAQALAEVALAHGGEVANAVDGMLACRDDEDEVVRAAVLRFIGYAGLAEHSAWLVSHAGLDGDDRDERLRAAARDGLRALGPRSADALLVELSFGRRSARDALLPLVSELKIGRGTLRELFDREIQSIRHRLVMLHASVLADLSPILVQRLGERLDEGLHTALHLAAAIHDDDRISSLAGPLRNSRGGRQHAILLEALESMLTPVEGGALMPLLEDQTAAERGRAAARALGVPVPSAEAVQRELFDDPDDLTRQIARGTLALGGGGALVGSADVKDDEVVLSPVERAMLLQGIPLFQGLSTRQLMNLAELVSEEEYPPGTTIVREGEPSDCMYFIVDGNVDVTTASNPDLARLGRNQYFGEIGVIAGSKRTANVITRDTKVSLLRLGREDLLHLMDELPGLGTNISQKLSALVADLTARVGDLRKQLGI